MKKGIRSGLAYKNGYKRYKLENRVQVNKIKKLVSHCRKYPEDTVAKDALTRLKKTGYIPRTKPVVPGSNKPNSTQKTLSFEVLGPTLQAQTAGEQLAKLLGIKLPEPKTYRKPKFTKKPTRRNVKKVS